MIVAVPPEPVRPLGDVKLFPRPRDRRWRDVRTRSLERLTRVGQLTPAALVVRVPNPDVEIGVDPGARKIRIERRRRVC